MVMISCCPVALGVYELIVSARKPEVILGRLNWFADPTVPGKPDDLNRLGILTQHYRRSVTGGVAYNDDFLQPAAL
jgi:hypothetical protein